MPLIYCNATDTSNVKKFTRQLHIIWRNLVKFQDNWIELCHPVCINKIQLHIKSCLQFCSRWEKLWENPRTIYFLLIHTSLYSSIFGSPPAVYRHQTLITSGVRPMTHTPETVTINRLYFSGTNFGCLCRSNLEADSSGTRFRRRLDTVLFQAIKWRARDWNDDLWLVDENCWRFHVLLSCCMQCCYLFTYLRLSAMFIFGARNFHSRHRRSEKPAAPKKMESTNGVCHGPKVSTVRGICARLWTRRRRVIAVWKMAAR